MFNRAAGGALPSVLSLAGRGLVPMYITYSDLFTFVIMLAAIITLVRNDRHKK